MTTKHIYLVSLISLGWLISTGCSSVTNFEDNIISSDNSNSETDSDTNIQKEEEEAVAQKVEELLATLTLDEKIGQMVQGQFEDATTNVIRNYCLGSVFSGGEEPVNPNNPENWADSIDAMQQAALDGCGIPILYGIDAVHGNGKVIGSTVFPHNIGLGASRDEELIEQIGRATGIECRGAGIHLTFAPAVSVVRDERWGRTYEGFGETPQLNADLGAAYVRGLQGMGKLSDPGAIAATAKHFMGDGGTSGGRNNGVNLFSDETMRTLHLPPYEAAVDEDVAAVMPSYHSWERDGVKTPITIDSYVLTDILKNELGFKGFALSDYDAIPRANGTLKTPYTQDNVTLAVNAGIDMAMIAMDGGIIGFIDAVYAGVKDGTIKQERIDDAVRRILRIKFKMGLFDNPFSNPELRAKIWSDEHQELAREAVRKSIVLLKNDNKALPLSTSETVALVGPYADSMGAQSGGWTVGWQGTAAYTERHVKGETIKTGLETLGGDKILWRERADDLGDADKIVVVIGEKPYAEGEGDHGYNSNSVYLRDAPNYSVLTEAMASGKQIILVIISGRPMILDDEVLNGCDAITAVWLPGSRGIGVADVLYGNNDFSGKLPHTWPASIEQIPVNVDNQNDEPGFDATEAKPLFPFGFGLTY